MAEKMTMAQLSHEIEVHADLLVRADEVLVQAIRDDDINSYLSACGVFIGSMNRIRQLKRALQEYKSRQQDIHAAKDIGAIDASLASHIKGL